MWNWMGRAGTITSDSEDRQGLVREEERTKMEPIK